MDVQICIGENVQAGCRKARDRLSFRQWVADIVTMRSAAFQMGALIAALIMATFVALEGETISEELGFTEGDPVLVFVVPRPESVRLIRAAVSEERVVWEGEAGFALASERVIASSFDSAGEVIKGAGWVDRPIEIVTLDAKPSDDDAGDPSDPKSREGRLARLRQLVNQPTLNYAEQVFVLQAMSDGIEL
jgi:hypothetical protein